jgi:hypothetical protein
MTEPTEDDYSNYFDDRGQPVRRGAVLTDSELATYREFFPETTDRTATKENPR